MKFRALRVHRFRRLLTQGLLGMGLMIQAVTPAVAQELSWRSSSIQGPRTPGVNTRIGVALFSDGTAATSTRRIVADGPPSEGSLTIRVETDYRFADGSTLVMHSRERIALTPAMTHAPGEWQGDGLIVSGTGRFAGASGSFRFRAIMGLDRRSDGVLGDGFLTGEGRYSLGGAAR